MADDDTKVERSNWLHAVKSYMKVTQESCLNLKSEGAKAERLKSILQLLSDSSITKLILDGNDIRGWVKDLCDCLKESKVTELSIKACCLSNKELLLLIKDLKDTQVVDIDVSSVELSLNKNDTSELISYLHAGKLSTFNFERNYFPFEDDTFTISSVQKLLCSSITHLNLSYSFCRFTDSQKVVTSLFSNLQHSSVKSLNLSNNKINAMSLKTLGENLRNSNIRELDLGWNEIEDEGTNFLFDALKRSNVENLNIEFNKIQGSNNLGRNLKDTTIRSLNLSSNFIIYDEMFDLPNFSRGSSVKQLNLCECHIGDEIGQKVIGSMSFTSLVSVNLAGNDLGFRSICKFGAIVKFTDLKFVDISYNDISCAVLGNCLKTSKLENVCVSYFQTYHHRDHCQSLRRFLIGTKGSAVVDVDMSFNGLDTETCELILSSLPKTTITHLNFSDNHLDQGILSLAPTLRFTAITHLNLSRNRIKNEGARILAKCLKETLIVDLNISRNYITSWGAKILAYSFKDSKLLRVDLSGNKIKNKGLEMLAEQVKNTLIIYLNTDHNLGNKSTLIDTVLWQNRETTQRLVRTFKRITLKSDKIKLCFDQNLENVDVLDFLEDCLLLYKKIVERPAAPGVLANESTISYSKNEIVSLISETFSKQFCEFIGTQLEANVLLHVDFLKKAENLGLSKIVEQLLFNRPLYIIDEKLGILHPYVYGLMYKYKLPICSSVEPQGKSKLMQYFLKNVDLEGAANVVRLLRDEKM